MNTGYSATVTRVCHVYLPCPILPLLPVPPGSLVSIHEIDFSLPTLDHLDEQFTMYGFVNPDLPPLLPEDGNNYLADLHTNLLDVSVADPSDIDCLCDVALPPVPVLQSNTAVLAQVMEHISPIS